MEVLREYSLTKEGHQFLKELIINNKMGSINFFANNILRLNETIKPEVGLSFSRDLEEGRITHEGYAERIDFLKQITTKNAI
jgi:hypothetical protein